MQLKQVGPINWSHLAVLIGNILRFGVVSCVGILQPQSYEFSTSRGGPLIFESDLCPGLGLGSPLGSTRGNYLSSIVLQPSFDIGVGKSPCVFNVTPLISNAKLQPKEEHPLRARVLGIFITDVPWPRSSTNKVWNDLCSYPLHIHVLIQQNLHPNNDHHFPRPLCRVSNEIFMATRRVRHLQSKIWYQSSTGRLALSVDKELDFTTKISKANPKEGQVAVTPTPPTFAHLMFLFNSSGQNCFIRVEHYRIVNKKSEEMGCDRENIGQPPEMASCDIYSCADELRLQLVTTDLWLKRGLRRLLSQQQHKLRPRSNEDVVKDDPGHPSIRLLLCAWTPVLLCIYLLCRRKNWTEDPETDEDFVGESDSQTGQNMNIKDLPPTYSEVLEMDTLSPPPPTYSDLDICHPSSTSITLVKIFKAPSFPTPTNV